MHNEDYEDEDYEPTKEEWQEIEKLILEEEVNELRAVIYEKKCFFKEFSEWCKENGMIW